MLTLNLIGAPKSERTPHEQVPNLGRSCADGRKMRAPRESGIHAAPSTDYDVAASSKPVYGVDNSCAADTKTTNEERAGPLFG